MRKLKVIRSLYSLYDDHMSKNNMWKLDKSSDKKSLYIKIITTKRDGYNLENRIAEYRKSSGPYQHRPCNKIGVSRIIINEI